MLPSGFEPESKPREGLMIGRTTLWEQMNNYPFEVISNMVRSIFSVIVVVSGIG